MQTDFPFKAPAKNNSHTCFYAEPSFQNCTCHNHSTLQLQPLLLEMEVHTSAYYLCVVPPCQHKLGACWRQMGCETGGVWEDYSPSQSGFHYQGLRHPFLWPRLSATHSCLKCSITINTSCYFSSQLIQVIFSCSSQWRWVSWKLYWSCLFPGPIWSINIWIFCVCVCVPGWGGAGSATATQKVSAQRPVLPDIWSGCVHGRSGPGLHLRLPLLLYTSCKTCFNSTLYCMCLNTVFMFFRFCVLMWMLICVCVFVCLCRSRRRTCSTAGCCMKTRCMPRCVGVRSWRKMSASTWPTTMRRSLCPCLTLEAATPPI